MGQNNVLALQVISWNGTLWLFGGETETDGYNDKVFWLAESGWEDTGLTVLAGSRDVFPALVVSGDKLQCRAV